jgi:PAS domain S-box-containing protein
MRLLVIDDHEVVRRGVRSLLQNHPDIEVCGEATDGQDALEKARQLRPDVVVMDVSMPRLNGLEATRKIRSMLPRCEVLILSQHQSAEMARQALKAGARGYVVKSSAARDLVAAVEKIVQGGLFFDAAILEKAISPEHLDVQEILQRSAAFERALRDSEELYRSTFELAAVGVAHVSPEGRWLRVNKKICEITGYTEAELLNMHFQDITHPEDLAADLADSERVLKGEIQMFSMEKRYIRKDRRIIWVNLTVSAARNAEGKMDHFISVVEDISERKRVEDALRESQAHLELALQSTGTAMFEWDVVRNQGSWNPLMEAIYGFTPKGEYVTAEEWRSLFHPEDTTRLVKEAEEVFRHKDRFQFEYRTVRQGGEIRWILSHGRVVRDENGQAVRLIGTHMDITERKRAEATQERQKPPRLSAEFEVTASG